MTNLSKTFFNKTNIESIRFTKNNIPKINEKCILATYTHIGKAPKEAIEFAKINADNIVGIIGFGDKMWGSQRYCRGAKDISATFNIPYLRSIERTGLQEDIDYVNDLI